MSDASIGVVACLFTVLCWTVGTFAFTTSARLISPATLNRVRLLYALIILSILTCIIEQFSPLQLVAGPEIAQFMWFGLSGMIGFTLGDYFAFHSFRILGGRRASVFICISPAAALVCGMIILDEHLSMAGIIGMAISIAGIMLLSLSRAEKLTVHEEGHGHFVQGISYAMLGAACQGVGLVFSKQGFLVGEHPIAAIHATWIRLIAATISAYAIGAFRTNFMVELKNVTLKAHIFRPVIIGSIVGPVLGVTASLVGVSKIDASVAQTLLSLTPISVTIASALFFRERIRMLSYISVVLSIIGVIILVWRDSL